MPELPEIKVARRVISRHGLVPPVDIEGLTRIYAELEIRFIPVQVDGVCLGLKSGVGKPQIVLNAGRGTPRRRRFTLAHELGHVLIPWHTGVIVDTIDEKPLFVDYNIEAEANRFASELLMPSDWVDTLISLQSNPFEIIEFVAEKAQVSSQAATYKVQSRLPAGYIYVEVVESKIKESFISADTHNQNVNTGDVFSLSSFPKVNSVWRKIDRERECLWFVVPQSLQPEEVPDSRGSRVLADEIFSELPLGAVEKIALRQSLGGVLGAANGSSKTARSIEGIYGALLHRTNNRAQTDENFSIIFNHPKFNLLLITKAHEFLKRL